MKSEIQKWLLTLCLLVVSLAATGETVLGTVVDSLTNQPVPFAAVQLVGTERGTLADESGKFRLSTSSNYRGVTASAMGYSSATVARKPAGAAYLLRLVPTGVQLSELTVKATKEKYSKKNNPALDLMRRIRQLRDDNDPRRNQHYNYDKYERITLALSDGASIDALAGKFPDLQQHVDTSVFTGKPILNLALREKSSHIASRNSPRSEKEIVSGLRSEGIDRMLDTKSTQTLYEDVLREIDIYSDNITVMQNRFVSPLSRLAPDFYKFYLNDTVTVGTDTCIVLAFTPHNPRGFGFTGKLYVDKNDPALLIRRVEMRVPAHINLNFIKNLIVVQEFDRAPDGSRLKTVDDMVVEAGVLSKDAQMYARRVTSLTGHDFTPPADARIFDNLASVITLPDASKRNESFWQSRRTVGISRSENAVGAMFANMRRSPLIYWSEQVLKVLVTGYIRTGDKSKWDFGPVNTLISYNDLEGVRLRVGGMSTANLSPKLFTRDYVAYGCRDRKWKYMTEWEYSFHDKEYHSREFPIHSLRFTHLYDVDMLGQHYLFTNPDNVFLSLKRTSDRLITYHRLTKLEYFLELENNFSVTFKAEHDRQEPSPWVSFINGAGQTFGHLTTSTLELKLRYAPGEKFYQTKSSRLPVNMDAPIIQLSHRWGPKGFAGNRFAVSVTELSFQKRFWFSAFGYVDAIVKGGHVWTRSAFTNLFIPNANLSYTIQPESFALMQPMEFVNDSYASWDLTYWLNGALFNYIPVIKLLKWREVVAFRGVWGHLSDKNQPDKNGSLPMFPAESNEHLMTSTPYMEISAGIDNIFRILRLDYVWRLSYRGTPSAPDGGLRLALHFSF